MWGPIISTVGNLVGGLLNKNSADDANEQSQRNFETNIKLQKTFAKEGIRWKVEDAKAAGIHPLYALGAQATSFSPVTAGQTADTSLGSAIASSGQDISRAMNATRTQPERDAAFTKTVQDMSLTKMGLENELLASQIAKLKSSINPAFPDVGPYPPIPMDNKQGERPPLQLGGVPWVTDPGTTNQEDFAKRYGDEGPASWATQAAVLWNDLKRNYPSIQDFQNDVGRLNTWLGQKLGPVPFFRLPKGR